MTVQIKQTLQNSKINSLPNSSRRPMHVSQDTAFFREHTHTQ
jgi:hypothetical protein